VANEIAIAGLISRRVLVRTLSNRRMLFFKILVNSLDVVTPSLATVALVRAFGTIKGWNLPEVELLVGVSGASLGLGMLFGGAFDSFLFDGIYHNGEFEASLLRPFSAALLIASSNVRSYRVGRILFGLVLVVYSLFFIHGRQLSVLAVLPLSLACGGICISLLFTIDASALIYLRQSNSATRSLPFAVADLGYYPTSLFPAVARTIAIFVLGIGSTAYLPISYALGKGINFGIGSLLIGPVVTLMIFVVCRMFWRSSVESYRKRGAI